MEPAGEDLAALNRKIRALRARERRPVAKEAETVSATCLGERKIHKVAMMVFVLSGHDAAVAADFLRGRGHGSDPTFRDANPDVGDLAADIEWACINSEVDDLVCLLEQPATRQQTALMEKAARYVVEHRLFQWTVQQNCGQGNAPSRTQMVQAAFRSLPKEVPSGMAPHIRSALCGGPRSERKWLARWRRHWFARRGKLRVRERLTAATIRAKAELIQ